MPPGQTFPSRSFRLARSLTLTHTHARFCLPFTLCLPASGPHPPQVCVSLMEALGWCVTSGHADGCKSTHPNENALALINPDNSVQKHAFMHACAHARTHTHTHTHRQTVSSIYTFQKQLFALTQICKYCIINSMYYQLFQCLNYYTESLKLIASCIQMSSIFSVEYQCHFQSGWLLAHHLTILALVSTSNAISTRVNTSHHLTSAAW